MVTASVADARVAYPQLKVYPQAARLAVDQKAMMRETDIIRPLGKESVGSP